MRLHKFLATAGIASRRQAEVLIQKGKISVNGKVVTSMGVVIDQDNDIVTYQDKRITLTKDLTYIALNKPVGYISSASSGQGKSVLALVKSKTRLYPVGRLDKDSSGLMILTNDGELTNKITHPKYLSEKEYFVILDRDLSPEDIKRLEKGMTINGQKVKGISVPMAQNKSARLVLTQGINRQIRRMLGKLGYTVVKLKRVRIGKLELGTLKEGQWRIISKDEIK